MAEQVAIPVPRPGMLRVVALLCFLVDVLLGLLQIDPRVHLISLGLAVWVASDALEK